MGLSQQIRQVQTQRITPQMMMDFSLLQLPIGELRDAVKKEVDSNPALEIERDYHVSSVPRSADETEMSALENLADERGETLDAHLLGELRMNGVEGRELAVAGAIVESLDRDGRLSAAYADLMMVLDGMGIKGVTEAELERVRFLVMQTDPQGCGARDLGECYRAQLGRIAASQRDAVGKAIDELAEALKKGRVAEFHPSNLQAFRLLKTLEPYPGRMYDRVRTIVVVPDVFVDEEGNVRVDQSDIPELRVSQKYVEMAKDRELDEETRNFAVDRVRRAREFREALIRRKDTMERIAEAVVSKQAGFLKNGASGLVRLTMTEIAKEAHCTIANVSRAAARKYVRTPRGTVPLRKFFVLSDQRPIEKLRELLASFQSGKRPSDAKLSELMGNAGYKMARRTVAKYRVRLGY